MTSERDRPAAAMPGSPGRSGTSPPAPTQATDAITIHTDGLEIVATRTFDAPRPLVFRAWSDCDALVNWWGPKDWTLPVCEMDFREGGSWFYCMQGPAGEQSCGRSSYREIVAPVRIVYTDVFADRDGTTIEAMPEMLITVEFEEGTRGTTVTSRSLFASAEDLETVIATGIESGLTETWDRLAAYLAQASEGSRA